MKKNHIQFTGSLLKNGDSGTPVPSRCDRLLLMILIVPQLLEQRLSEFSDWRETAETDGGWPDSIPETRESNCGSSVLYLRS